jgi:hypothetical protein
MKKEPLERPSYRWEDIIVIYIKKVEEIKIETT